MRDLSVELKNPGLIAGMGIHLGQCSPQPMDNIMNPTGLVLSTKIKLKRTRPSMKVLSIQQHARNTLSRLRMRKRNWNWARNRNHMGWGNLFEIASCWAAWLQGLGWATWLLAGLQTVGAGGWAGCTGRGLGCTGQGLGWAAWAGAGAAGGGAAWLDCGGAGAQLLTGLGWAGAQQRWTKWWRQRRGKEKKYCTEVWWLGGY
ncbi:hypothetical protein Acr_00g0095910 [Actinidia rufa]|uniref:Uncharacterized protein n=1 Tax=Actinidia rufa TaxID=165716 RepID=A0A7J0DZL5_9ERIC|nr:hypothetical protein Acr_00g0095910 [Actinidia rufa]